MCAGSLMVWCRAHTRAWSATSTPSHHAHPIQIGVDVDAAADRGRVD
jgi:hypothetical protein